jgi:hypothetical protein
MEMTWQDWPFGLCDKPRWHLMTNIKIQSNFKGAYPNFQTMKFKLAKLKGRTMHLFFFFKKKKRKEKKKREAKNDPMIILVRFILLLILFLFFSGVKFKKSQNFQFII